MGALDTAKEIIDKGKNKAMEIKDQAVNSVSSLASSAVQMWNKSSDAAQSDGPFSVAEIGKPFKFTSDVDPSENTHRFLLTRMNSVDIYPCNYAQQFLSSPGEKAVRFKYGVHYQNAMKEYQTMCKTYLGVNPAPSALRIFLTDDTTVSDGLSTQYQANFFQATADKLGGMAQNIVNMGASMDTQRYRSLVDQAFSNVSGQKIAGAIVEPLSGLGLGEKTKDVMGRVIDSVVAGAKIVLKGNKLSLPKIWQNSTYTPSFSVSTKLFSPYGSPKAIKENVIKPLTYILLMATPHSDDMVSYGRPFACTVRAWGSSFLSLAGITSLTISRGGQDSVYNIYKQPLVVNVNIQFGTLVDGMLAFSSLDTEHDIPQYERDSFATSDQILHLDAKSQTIDGSKLPTVVPTVGGLIRSFQPVSFSGVNSGYGPSQSTRFDVMIGGNPAGNTVGVMEGAVGFLSPFNSALNYATGSALEEASFGKQILDGVTGFVSGAAYAASNIVGSFNNTVGQLTSIANTVSFGAFAQTDFAKQISKTQNTINQNVGRVNQVAGAMNTINTAVQKTTDFFGSLLDFPLGRRNGGAP